MTTQLAGQRDAVPAVQPRATTGGAGNPPNPDGPSHRLPVGAGLAAGRLARPARTASCTSRRPTKGSTRPSRRPSEVIFPRYHQWDAVLKLEADAARARRGPELPRAALGGVGQVEHDRLARAPAVDPARRGRPQGVRQGGGDHRPRGARPPAAGHDLPVRARPRRGREDRRGLDAARGGAGGRAGADHHHHAAEVPVRPRQGRRAARAPLRGDRGRGPLLADRRGGQGPAAASSARPRSRSSTEAEAEDAGYEAARGRPGRGRARQGGWRRGAPAEPVVLRVHRHAEGQDARTVRHAATRRPRTATCRSTSTRCARRSRRASSSTCSPTTRPTRPTGRSRRRSRDDPEYDDAQGAAGDRPVRAPAPAQPCAEGRDHRRALPRSTRGEDRRAGEGDGRHLLPPARRALQAGHRQVHRRARATTDVHDARRVLGHGDRREASSSPSQHERLPGDADRRASSPATTTRCSSSPRSSRPASTSRCCTRCSSTSADRPCTPCRPSPGSTASTPTRPTRSSSTSATSRGHRQAAFEPYYEAPSRSRPTRTCSTTRAAHLDEFDVLREDESRQAVAASSPPSAPRGPRRRSTRCSIRRSNASRARRRGDRTSSATR